MNHAIATLKAALACHQTNEPIRRREGRLEEADRDLAAIGSLRLSIAILKAADQVRGLSLAVKAAIPAFQELVTEIDRHLPAPE